MSESVTLTPFWSGFVVGALGLLAAAALMIGLIARRHKRAVETLRDQSEQWLAEKRQLDTALAIAEQKLASLAKADSLLESTRQELLAETTRRVQAEQQVTRIAELERNLSEKEATLAALQNETARLKAGHADLAARIEEERIKAAEKLELIKSAEQQMIHQFESLGAKILEEKAKIFTEQNRLNLDRLLSPLREQLGEFRKKVDDVYIADSNDRASLREAIRTLNLENQRISQEASNLARALKGDKKIQGTWGELVLEKVLEQSGLRKGVEYHSQGGFRDPDNRLLKPDVVVHLPEGKDVIIDSKVSLVAYETHASAETDEIRQQALIEHIQAVRAHIKGLSEKDYSNVRGVRSLDFVLMFMPIETAFMLAFEHDDSLFSEAFQRNIIVVTPTTLLATLRTIENIWRYERQNENTRIIAGKAASLYDKIRGFVEDFDRLGTQILTLQGTYEHALNKLSQGKGNLLRQAGSFVDLGVKVRKTLPKSMLQQSSADDEFELPEKEKPE